MKKLTLETYEKMYLNLPKGEQVMPIAIIDNITYTWKQVSKEVKKKTPLANKMIEFINKILRLSGEDNGNN